MFGNSECNDGFSRSSSFDELETIVFSLVALGAMLVCTCCCCYCCYKQGEKAANRRLTEAARNYSVSPMALDTQESIENTVNMAYEEINGSPGETHVAAIPNPLRNDNYQTIQPADMMTYHTLGQNSPANVRFETQGPQISWSLVERIAYPPPAYSELSCAQRRIVPSAPLATYRSSVSGRFHPPSYDNVMCDPETFHLHI